MLSPPAADVPSDLLLLDIRQAARLLNTSRTQLYRLLRAGQGPRPVKLGAKTRFTRAAIVAYIASLPDFEAPAAPGDARPDAS